MRTMQLSDEEVRMVEQMRVEKARQKSLEVQDKSAPKAPSSSRLHILAPAPTGTTFEKVKALLVESLGVDEEDVTPEATLVRDLGAESIDFLDITFRLKKVFGIKIKQNDWWPEDILQNPKYVVGNHPNYRFTPEGVTELKRRLPSFNFSQLDVDPQVKNFQVNVATLVTYIDKRLKEGG